jgi:citrate (Si)-synthase
VRPAQQHVRCASILKKRLVELMPVKQEALTKMKKEHGAKIVDKVTIDQLIGGARSIKSMLWETSLLDPLEGIRFRGYTIPELQEKLPGYKTGGEPTPEALLWLLLTGEVPTKEQCDALTADLHARRADDPRLPQGHAPDDAALVGDPGAADGERVRERVRQGHQQEKVLGAHV